PLFECRRLQSRPSRIRQTRRSSDPRRRLRCPEARIRILDLVFAGFRGSTRDKETPTADTCTDTSCSCVSEYCRDRSSILLHLRRGFPPTVPIQKRAPSEMGPVHSTRRVRRPEVGIDHTVPQARLRPSDTLGFEPAREESEPTRRHFHC